MQPAWFRSFAECLRDRAGQILVPIGEERAKVEQHALVDNPTNDWLGCLTQLHLEIGAPATERHGSRRQTRGRECAAANCRFTLDDVARYSAIAQKCRESPGAFAN